ncbi:MAG: helix-turn-helix domain-containing protein [Methanothrix sp.]|nr:helix-turn-helix domain-containing protein [Methanothrix sp.]MCX8206226.1 helix-turn-helix domain-containing protein [Methanothrix sp.]
MRSPCEEIVWEVLPGIRATIAQELVRRGVSQREVSRLMDVTPAAVSQYVSGKRGYNIVFRDDIRKEIARLAEDLMNGCAVDLIERICEICKKARGEELCPVEIGEKQQTGLPI